MSYIFPYPFLALDILYIQGSPSGCCLVSGDFHQRCQAIGSLSKCKNECDIDVNCKGYVGKIGFLPVCQIATTSDCPSSFSQDDVGNVGDLDINARCSKSSYQGCFIKQSGK